MDHDDWLDDDADFIDIEVNGFQSGIYELDLIIKNLERCGGLNVERKTRICDILDRYLNNLQYEIGNRSSQYYLKMFMDGEDKK